MGRMLLFCATVFLSAFLLFQVQPLIGKTILPWFGSTPGVWTTCMLFFQVLLLGGYAYAHLLVSRLEPRRQAMLHGGMLLLALVALPITPRAALVPDGDEAPVATILLVLATSVGAPYLLLSATGPLLQGWFARLHPGRSPYRLYALGNVGSLLALLSYPLWVEGAFGLSTQALGWSGGFALFAVLAGGCAWTLARADARAAASADAVPTLPEAPAPTAGLALLWFGLAATASALLLATTNQMCLDVAVVPFLWVLPLALYLLSFILTFDHARWYARPVFLALLPLALWRAYALVAEGVHADIGAQVVGYALALFVVCMACHGELARSKPAPRHLTWFFLVISLGGAAGGSFVALGAPLLFDDYLEFPLLLAVAYALVLVAVARNLHREPHHVGRPVLRVLTALGGVAVLGAALFVTMRFLDPAMWHDGDSRRTAARAEAWFASSRHLLWVPVLLVPLLAEGLRRLRGVPAATWWRSARVNLVVAAGILLCLPLGAMVGGTAWLATPSSTKRIAQDRNFYGALAIKEYYADTEVWDWTLKHGRIMHGFQYRRHPDWPTSYYGPESGVGLAIRYHPARTGARRPLRIGVVGLGTGTLAAYANAHMDTVVTWDDHDDYVTPDPRSPGDVVRFYEVNPLVASWAWEHFTFLSDARERGADVDVFLGDARLVMERQRARGELQAFDVLAIDAFSSDAIPIHLLTKESFEVYWAHLAEDGVLAMHVTNRFIDLRPVVRRLADELGKPVVAVQAYKDEDFGVSHSDWMILTDNEALLRELRLVEEELPPAATVLWTDDYSSVWPLVKLETPVRGWRDLLPLLGFPGERDR